MDALGRGAKGSSGPIPPVPCTQLAHLQRLGMKFRLEQKEQERIHEQPPFPAKMWFPLCTGLSSRWPDNWEISLLEVNSPLAGTRPFPLPKGRFLGKFQFLGEGAFCKAESRREGHRYLSRISSSLSGRQLQSGLYLLFQTLL